MESIVREDLGFRQCAVSSLESLAALGSASRFVLVLAALTVVPRAAACTIFVLTDKNRTLFCNNEDFSNPNTRMWFVPAGKGYLGCVYVGFDDGVEQGGTNTKGLAYDAVAGYKEDWKADRGLATARGNPMARMLETCSTVEESIAFFRRHRFPWFSQLKMLVADKSGRSVILGAKRGQLQVEEASQCRGFGYGQTILDSALGTPPAPTVENGIAILRACAQKGEDATKYSNIFDLKSGDIFLFPAGGPSNGVKFNLRAELAKGAHYYDMLNLDGQLTQAPLPLLDNMKRLLIDRFKPIPDGEPNITEHIRAVIQDTLDGRSRADDYTPEYWNEVKPKGFSAIFDETWSNSKNDHLALVDRRKDGDKDSYRYLVEFSDAVFLLRFVLSNDKVSLIELDGMQLAYP